MSKFSAFPPDPDVPDSQCDVCGKFTDACECPECTVCGSTGDMRCFQEHHLPITFEVLDAARAYAQHVGEERVREEWRSRDEARYEESLRAAPAPEGGTLPPEVERLLALLDMAQSAAKQAALDFAEMEDDSEGAPSPLGHGMLHDFLTELAKARSSLRAADLGRGALTDEERDALAWVEQGKYSATFPNAMHLGPGWGADYDSKATSILARAFLAALPSAPQLKGGE